MLEKVLTGTKILSLDVLSAETLDNIVLYLAGADANVAIISERRPFPQRDEVVAGLKALRNVTYLDNVRPNPEVSDIMAMCEILEAKSIDVIVGIGGGSTMDSAKGVAAVLSNGGNLEEYLGPAATRKITEKKVKLILVPTTTGTGAEVTNVGVYTSMSGRKYTLGSPLLPADVALLVGSYVKTLPKSLIASTGFDALSHSLECK